MYSLAIAIADYSPAIEDIPSLLGRDILNRWRMSYQPSRSRLYCRVESYDYRIDV